MRPTVGADDYARIVKATEVRPSPDGALVLLRIWVTDGGDDAPKSWLEVRGLESGEITLLEPGVSLARWSGDGARLFCVHGGDGGSAWLSVREARPWGTPRRVADLPGSPDALEVAPGDRLALVETRIPRPPAFAAELPDPVSTHPVRIVDHASFRDFDGGWLTAADPVLAVVDLHDGSTRRIQAPDGVSAEETEDAYGWDATWVPDGSAIVASLSTGWDARMRLPARQRDLYRIGVADGSFTRLTDDPRIDTSPAVSPDGRNVAFLRQVGDPQAVPFQNEVWVLDIASGEARPIAIRDRDVDVTGVAWLDDGYLAVSFHERADRAVIGRLALDGSLSVLTREARVRPTAPDRLGRMGNIRERPDAPGNPCLVDDRGARDIAELNPWLAERRLSRLESIDYPSAHRDRRPIHALVAIPPDAGDDVADRPVIVDLHGGPDAAAWTGFDIDREFFAGQGYVVIQPDYRGSRGFGAAFLGLSGYRRYPGWIDDPDADHEMGLDVLGVLDAIRERGLGDPGRVFLRGFSAGALLTTWVLGRVGADSPFLAGTAHSWYPGEWGAPTYGAIQPRAYFDGLPWTPGHRDEAARRDPTMLLDRLSTPLLLLHGESDHTTTLTEVETYYYAARTRPVEVVMAVFPDEGHWIGHHPRNLRDRLLIEAGWYARHDRSA